jgi:hypothetical protein
MYNDFIPLVSEEQLGAFLEGNLSESENIRIRNLISHDESLKEIMDVNDIVDENITMIEDSAFQYDCGQVDLDSFELPLVAGLEMYYDDAFELPAAEYNQFEDQNTIDNNNEFDSINIGENPETHYPDNTLDL